jgi:hypothetical protein
MKGTVYNRDAFIEIKEEVITIQQQKEGVSRTHFLTVYIHTSPGKKIIILSSYQSQRRIYVKWNY